MQFVHISLYNKCLPKLYERRMKFVKNGEESKKFAEINESYMTDESMSDSCGSDVVRRHKHPWRSEGKEIHIHTNSNPLFFFLVCI